MQQHSYRFLPVLLFVLGQAVTASSSWKHAVIIDAGSTGSRAHVFRYSPSASPGTYPNVDLPEAVLKTTPGLSSYASNPKAAAASLQPLIKFAQDKVPQGQWQHTSIRLFGTAGLRMLQKDKTDAILKEVTQALAVSGFAFEPSGSAGPGGVRLLSGSEEGLLSWVALNYASGALQASPPSGKQQPERLGRKDLPSSTATSSSTTSQLAHSNSTAASQLQGVLELGGGSLQVTFLPAVKPPQAEAAPLALPSLGSGRLYSRSYDGLGLQAALQQWAAHLRQRQQSHDPCLPVGFTKVVSSPGSPGRQRGDAPGVGVRGSGDWRACKAGVLGLLPKAGRCLHSSCGLRGSFLPALNGTTFIGVDNVHYTASALGLPTTKPTSLSDLDRAAGSYCGLSWAHIKAHHLKHHKGDSADSYHVKLCFSAALILALLGEGLHLPRSQPLITASNSITTPRGRRLEAKWPLGALVVDLVGNSSKPSEQHSRASSTPRAPSTHKHPLLGSEEGLSPGSATALAAAFCLSLLAFTLCASWLGVGLPGSGRCGPPWQCVIMLRLLCNSSIAKLLLMGSVGGSKPGSGGGGSSGLSSSVKYMRVRPVSRTAGAGARSRSGSPQRSGGAESEGSGSIMLSVMQSGGGREAASSWVVVEDQGISSSKPSSRPGGVVGRQRQ